ncbi:hypothetical protein GIB67_013323 [Kingdonia uniflora]|uniref:Uncharacterized protein n=1 Tax=Kingdonia uniflora TaxID=39325 RepID=A0A7J7LQZ8_9MAGN|nr:hypothetical protein GIB67_013323 [Kingdonia uniflora]
MLEVRNMANQKSDKDGTRLICAPRQMGLTGGLVRSVFSKNRSVRSYDNNMRSGGVDKRRWSSVRSYLCGDEFNSVQAEDDSASHRSSEATVTQPVQDEELKDELEIQNEEEENSPESLESNSNRLLTEENAAIVIQSALRHFLARHGNEGSEQMDEMQGVQVIGSPSRESIGTSVEAQTGGSVEALTIREERIAAQHRMQQKARMHASRLKEDWDDSTVSSNISKLRIQNRLEATTRRERALAYAFSQQLRVCSKKKQEANMGWTWLERWMATRLPENSIIEDNMIKQPDPISSDQRSPVNKNHIYAAGEEKESCGSNEVFVGVDFLRITAPNVDDGHKPAKNRLKARRTLSRRKTVYQYPTQLTKVNKKDYARESGKEKIHKQLQQSKSAREYNYKDASSQVPSALVSGNSSE